MLRVPARRESQAVRLDSRPAQQPKDPRGPIQLGRVHAPRQDHPLGKVGPMRIPGASKAVKPVKAVKPNLRTAFAAFTGFRWAQAR